MIPVKQQRTLDTMRAIIAEGGRPTMQAIADKIGVSKITVYESVQALTRKGLVTKMVGPQRNGRYLPADTEVVVPLVAVERVLANSVTEPTRTRMLADIAGAAIVR